MPLQGGNNGVSCVDCYFFQEQLCARTGSFEACGNFRPTVGTALRSPRQAQLIPVPRPQLHTVESLRPSRAVPETSVAAPEVHAAPLSAPIDRVDEALAVMAAQPVSGPGAMSVTRPQRAVAAVAEHTERGTSVTIPLADDQPAAQLPLEPVQGTQPVRDRARHSRVARRIAERYPRAMQLC